MYFFSRSFCLLFLYICVWLFRLMIMGKHRSRLEILANILDVVNGNDGSAKRTQIMYQAYLSYSLLVQYLNDASAAGLVACDDGSCYRLTSKGEYFLAKFVEYDKSCEEIEEMLGFADSQRVLLEKMCPSSP